MSKPAKVALFHVRNETTRSIQLNSYVKRSHDPSSLASYMYIFSRPREYICLRYQSRLLNGLALSENALMIQNHAIFASFYHYRSICNGSRELVGKPRKSDHLNINKTIYLILKSKVLIIMRGKASAMRSLVGTVWIASALSSYSTLKYVDSGFHLQRRLSELRSSLYSCYVPLSLKVTIPGAVRYTPSLNSIQCYYGQQVSIREFPPIEAFINNQTQ